MISVATEKRVRQHDRHADGTTINAALLPLAVAAHGDRPSSPCLAEPARLVSRRVWKSPTGKPPSRSGCTGRALSRRRVRARYRVATLLENRPDCVLHKLAAQPARRLRADQSEYRAGEIAHLLEHKANPSW